MIGVVVFILLGIVVLEFIIAGLKYLLDGAEANAEYYRICENCNTGFCMEDPGSDECKRIRRELKNE